VSGRCLRMDDLKLAIPTVRGHPATSISPDPRTVATGHFPAVDAGSVDLSSIETWKRYVACRDTFVGSSPTAFSLSSSPGSPSSSAGGPRDAKVIRRDRRGSVLRASS
jgi:hypothetical protein